MMGPLFGKALVAAVILVAHTGPAEDRIYGRVVTRNGETHTGFIRWTRGESTWADLLPGFKPLPPGNFEETRALRAAMPSERAQAARTIDFMGIRVTWDEDDETPPARTESGVRFGHIRAMARVSDDALLVALKSGEEVEISSTPPGAREASARLDSAAATRGRGAGPGEPTRIVVGAPDGTRQAILVGPGGRAGNGPNNPPPRITLSGPAGEVQILLADVATVELSLAPSSAPVPVAAVYGSVEDRYGGKFTGYLGWGIGLLASDEIFGLEGQPERRIPLTSVASIERVNGSRGRMILTSGEEVVLAQARAARGQPAVPRSPFGTTGVAIRVSDPSLGVVQVSWNSLKVVRFHAPPEGLAYDRFLPATEITGTVVSVSGDSISGRIRWDNDETGTWEVLNGRSRQDTYQVELAQVARIERLNTQRSRITLRDGRSFELASHNDVGWGNKGVVVTQADGGKRLVEWVDLRELRLAR